MTTAADFRRRAAFEARRYGGDAWVFVRELLQNARDAGATRVAVEAGSAGGRDRIVCRDDGSGMDFDHARRYLLTLYASSKRKSQDTAGRFGIGFWSVLRFRPDEIIVRSAPDRGDAWGLGFSGDLREVRRVDAVRRRGTEVVLEREHRGVDVADAVWNAVRRDARHLRRQGSEAILRVEVNGCSATDEIELEAPSFGFRRKAVSGAVALAETPRVDLLAHGLRVRTAATLGELLTQPERSRGRLAVPNRLVPRVVLDSSRLQVMMARGDARTDGELRRLVALGRRAVRRLVADQLDREAAVGPVGRAAGYVREVVSSTWGRRLLIGSLVVAAGIAGAFLAPVPHRSPPASTLVLPPRGDGDPSVRSPSALLADEAARSYEGPAVGPARAAPAALGLSYRPVGRRPLFAILRVASMDDGGRVLPPPSRGPVDPGIPCRDACLEVSLEVGDDVDLVRLPVPTGHVLDPASVAVVGGGASLGTAGDGVPLLVLEGEGKRLVEYRTGPAPEPPPATRGRWPGLPGEIETLARDLGAMDRDEAVGVAVEWVRQHVAYDTSVATNERHVEAAADGLAFADRCLAVAAGDCDVLNALLATILHAAGMTVRMAVGVVGVDGSVLPGLHAWVEVWGEDGRWRWADASAGQPGRPPSGNAARAGVLDGAQRSLSRGGVTPEADGAVPVFRGGSLVVAGILVASAGVLATFAIRRRRFGVRDVRWADGSDLSGLLRGALTRPDSYREVPAVFSRPVVPVFGGRRISLATARRLAGRGRLGVSVGPAPFEGPGGGRVVVDGSRKEGAAVASILGAVDLDRWRRVVDGAAGDEVTRRLETAAAAHGAEWRVVLVSGSTEGPLVIDGGWIGLDRGGVAVSVGARSRVWLRIAGVAETRPSLAVLLLAEAVAGTAPKALEDAEGLMTGLAVSALGERAGEHAS